MSLRAAPTTRQLLLNKAATTDKGLLDLGAPLFHHTLQVNSGLGVSAGVITIEGSLDGVTFLSLGTVTTNAASSSFFAQVTGTFRYIQARVSTTVTGGTVNAFVASSV